MVNKLGLSGNDLLVYAVIYGFSQDEKSVFKGSLSYLADCLNISRRAVVDILNRLVKKGMIIKKEYTKNGQKYCEYRTPKDQNPQNGPPGGGEDSAPGGGEDSAPGVVKILHRGGEDSAPYITIDITNNNTSSSDDPPPAEKSDPGFLEEEAGLKQRIKNLNAALIFDRAFYPKACEFMKAFRLDADYLSWLYDFCAGQKPRNMAGYYYTAFFNPQLVELYWEAVRSRPPPPDRPVSCPVCGTGHPADRDCPHCGLEPKDRNDPEAVDLHRRLHALPEDMRGAYERELEVLIRETARGDFAGYSKRFIDLSEKYGLGP
ncbi:MAG: helix-turn-helix domain-containing protein [Treponema sp.]|nr:helix-turn-helix domain-containing protein [Treponema sp.]